MNDFLDRMLGHTVRGGCQDCDAEQELVQDPEVPGVYLLQVRHDDTCPTYRRMKRKGRAR